MNFDREIAFKGIRALYGEDGFKKLQHAKVTVVGIGGVGSWCAESLCRSGVGSLVLIDGDNIELSNLNRQLHTNAHNEGLAKVDVMKNHLLSLNPELDITIHHTLLSENNIGNYFGNISGYVCECIDDIEAKAYLINYLHERKIDFIVAGGAGGRKDPAKLQIGNILSAKGDALIKKVRQTLKKKYGLGLGPHDLDIACTFSSEKPTYSSKQDFLENNLPAFGASMCVTACSGLLMSSWILNKIVRS
jgi:tRNA A37 threonylcarbamoyladenosine dehydratase